MVSPGVVIPLDQLRDAVRVRGEATSLRAVAAELGISYGALYKFLEGSTPYAANLAKITTWYIQVAEPNQLREVVAALELLVTLIPEPERERTRNEIRAVIQNSSRRGSSPLPRWWRNLK